MPNRVVPLPDNAVLHTPGLCMILSTEAEPEKVVSANEKRQKELEAKQKLNLKEKKELLDLKSKIEKEKKNQIASVAVVHGLSFLDTQGTNIACQDDELTDVRATEHLLRSIIIKLATVVVFTVRSFNRQSQIQIKALIKQLDKAGNPVGKHNPLYVIHNLRDVKDRETMKNLIEEVRQIYDHEPTEEPAHNTQSNQKAWLEVPIEGDIYYYDARGSRHFFLGDNSVLEEYNTKVLKAISDRLLEHNEPQLVNILKKVPIIASTYLSGFIRDYSHKLTLIDDDGQLTFVPVRVDDKGEIAEETDDDKQMEDFKLKSLQFFDDGPKGDQIYDLEGRVCFSPEGDMERPTKMKVQLKCSGLSEEDLNKKCIRFIWDPNNQFVKIYILFPDVSPGDGWKVVSGLSSFHGSNTRGHYVAELPEDYRVLRFRPLANPSIDIYKLLVLEDGILEFELDILPDPNKIVEKDDL